MANSTLSSESARPDVKKPMPASTSPAPRRSPAPAARTSRPLATKPQPMSRPSG